MADPPVDPDRLRRLAPNRAVHERIEDGAAPSSDGIGPWSPDGWVMRTHPDLTEALEAAAVGTGLVPAIVFGLTTLLDPGDLVVAVGWGTGRVWLRIVDGPALERALDGEASRVPGLADFVAIDAWGLRQPLADWVDASAILLGSGRRSHA